MKQKFWVMGAVILSLLGGYYFLKNTDSTKEHVPSLLQRISSSAKSFFQQSEKDSLTIPEYCAWIENHPHITIDQVSNESYEFQLLYRPIALEAAFDMESAAVDKWKEYHSSYQNKKDFHYFWLECTVRSQSAAAVGKGSSDLLKKIEESIRIVKGRSDTLSPIIEVFPSMVMNQPHQVLILVPRDGVPADITCHFSGAEFQTKDAYLNIEQTQFDHFPKIIL